MRTLAAVLALLTAFTLVPGLTSPAQAAASDTCDGSFTENNLKISASHATTFYTDFGKSLDAAYVGYTLTNTALTSKSNLWMQIGTFTAASGSTVVGLADTTDNQQQIASLSASGTATRYFLLKATSTSAVAQKHVVKVYDRRPDLAGATVLYTCGFSFSAVSDTTQASANKVTGIASSPSSLYLGSTLVVTVNGDTGQTGAGGIVWVSPAGMSSWPSKALRLESTKIEVDTNGDGTVDSTYNNVLYLSPVSYTSSTKYTATYTFRLTAPTATDPTVVPVAQISSGGQIKHSPIPAAATVATSGVSTSISVAKTLNTASLVGLPTTTAPNGVSGSTTYTEVPYKITVSSTGGTSIVDEVVDVPASGMIFKNGSAVVTDATPFSNLALANPVTSSNDTGGRAGALHYAGPFTASVATAITLTYTMYVPVTTGTYTNQAFATLNGTAVGSNATTIPGISITTDGSALTGSATTSGGIGATAQTISFGSISNATMIQSRTASATASSGLAVTYSSDTTGVCTVNSSTGVITNVAAGTCTIRASQAGNGTYSAAADVTQTFTLTKATQSISLNAITDASMVQSRTASATATSSLAVTYSSDTTGVCTVNASSGAITNVSPGTCTIRAVQAGDYRYSAATDATTSFAISLAGQSITFTALSASTMLSSVTASASANSGLAVTYSSGTTNVCTVNSSTGVVTLVGEGDCTLYADQPGNGNYAAASRATRTFAVSKVPQTITFGAIADATVLQSRTASASTDAPGLSVTYASTTPLVCSVNAGSGVVTYTGTGTCTITADQAGNVTYSGASTQTRSFLVSKVAQTITYGAIADATMLQSRSASASTDAPGLSVAYSSSTPGVCTVDASTGEITYVAHGTCTVNADQAGNGTYAAATRVSHSFAVSQIAQTITFGGIGNATMLDSRSASASTDAPGLSVAYSSTTTGVCTVDASTGVIAFVAAGTCTIHADQPGTAVYSAANRVSHSFTVSQVAQSISFTDLTDATLLELRSASATTDASGLSVAYSSGTTGVCTVDASTGAITFVSTGTCTIHADQPGSAAYSAASRVSHSFAISKAPQQITFPAIGSHEITDGTTTAGATTNAVGLSIAYSVLDSTYCTVDAAGTITLNSVGSCTVYADQGGNGTYAAATRATRTFWISAVLYDQAITFPVMAGINARGSRTAAATTDATGLNVTYSSDDTSICTVDAATGVVTPVKAGDCYITASQPGDATYHPASDVRQLLVISHAPQAITFPALAAMKLTGSQSAAASTDAMGLSVTYSSVTPMLCTVDAATGEITPLGLGDCEIEAAQSGDDVYAAATPVSKITRIGKGDQTITFPAWASFHVLSGGGTAAASTDAPGLSVTYSADDTSVCTVDSTSGAITPVAVGDCSITASQGGGMLYNAASDVRTRVAITKAPQAITFPAWTQFDVLGSGTASAITDASGLNVTYSSDDTSVCTVDASSGAIAPVDVGDCTIRAHQSGNGTYLAATETTRTVPIGKGRQTISFAPWAAFDVLSSGSASASTDASGLSVTYTSDDTGVCTVDSVSGAITPVAIGDCSITARQIGNGRYLAATPVTRVVAIGRAAQHITFPSITGIDMLGSASASASTDASGLSVTYTSDDTRVCAVDGVSGAVTPIAAGTCTVHADQGGNGIYAAASRASRSFLISRAAQHISFPVLSDIDMLGSAAASAATDATGLDVAYTSDDTNVCTVDSATGSVTPVAAGTCTIHADQPGNGIYAPANRASRAFAISKVGQTITFPEIGSREITDGTASASASTNAPGLAVDYSVVDSSICTVDASTGVVTLVAVGTCTVHADQDGNGIYAPAHRSTRAFYIAAVLLHQAITFPDMAAITAKGSRSAGASTDATGLHVVYSSSDPTVCSVDSSTGEITPHKAGDCWITADQPGDLTYRAATGVTKKLVINHAPQVIAFPAMTPFTMLGSGTAAATTDADGLNVTYSSDDTSICTVDPRTGVITPVSAGDCTVNADQAGDDVYHPASRSSRTVAISKVAQHVTLPPVSRFRYGTTSSASASTDAPGLTPGLTSATPSICTIDPSSGVITPVSVGTCRIEAVESGTSIYATASAQIDITIDKGQRTITFPALSDTSFTDPAPTAAASVDNGDSITYSSVTPLVCGVDASTGAITLYADGDCEIAADQAGTALYEPASRVTRSFRIHGTPVIVRTPQTINFPRPADAVITDGPIQLSATATSGLVVTYTSQTPATCTVIAPDLIRLRSAGDCVVVASQIGDPSWLPAADVRRMFSISRARQTIDFAALPDTPLVDGSIPFTATSSAGLPVTVRSLTADVCKVDGERIMLLDNGDCRVEATQPGNGTYGPATPVVQAFMSYLTGEASGVIWFDTNANGKQDANEPPMPGATVTLAPQGRTRARAVPSAAATVVTDASGNYQFPYLKPGKYVVRVLAASTMGIDPAWEADEATEWQAAVRVKPLSDSQANLAALGKARMGGDARLDSSLRAVPGALVRATWAGIDGIPGTSDDVTFETTASGDGTYSFVGMPYGTYSYQVADPVTRSFGSRVTGEIRTPVTQKPLFLPEAHLTIAAPNMPTLPMAAPVMLTHGRTVISHRDIRVRSGAMASLSVSCRAVGHLTRGSIDPGPCGLLRTGHGRWVLRVANPTQYEVTITVAAPETGRFAAYRERLVYVSGRLVRVD